MPTMGSNDVVGVRPGVDGRARGRAGVSSHSEPGPMRVRSMPIVFSASPSGSGEDPVADVGVGMLLAQMGVEVDREHVARAVAHVGCGSGSRPPVGEVDDRGQGNDARHDGAGRASLGLARHGARRRRGTGAGQRRGPAAEASRTRSAAHQRARRARPGAAAAGGRRGSGRCRGPSRGRESGTERTAMRTSGGMCSVVLRTTRFMARPEPPARGSTKRGTDGPAPRAAGRARYRRRTATGTRKRGP